MKEEEIKELFEQFEAIANEYEGVECWSARELAQVLGYSKWERFEGVIERAKDACINAGEMVEYHFPGVGKMIPLAKGAQREVKDYMLTRYACYLIAQNGDPRKPQISFAQNYFAVQTRRAELVQKRLLEYERVQARAKLAETEKRLSGVLYERGVDSKGFAIIRSLGDKALFNLDTALLKRKLGAPNSRPLADFLPTLNIKASNPQPIGFSGILLAKRQNSFYCTYFLHNRNVADTKSPYPIKRLEVIRWFNQKSMVFNQSLS